MFRHPDAIFDIVCTLQCLYFVSAFSTYQISGTKRTRVEYMHFHCLWCLFVVIHAHIQFVTAYSIIFIETRNFDCAVFPVLYHVTCFVCYKTLSCFFENFRHYFLHLPLYVSFFIILRDIRQEKLSLLSPY